MTTLKVGIADYEEMKARTMRIAKGEEKPAPGDPKVWFTSTESFAQILSSGNRELLRVIELDPHEVGVASANWTTGRLVTYLAQQTGIAVSDETVRQYLLAHDYVCKRPTWTLQRRAAEQEGYVGNA